MTGDQVLYVVLLFTATFSAIVLVGTWIADRLIARDRERRPR